MAQFVVEFSPPIKIKSKEENNSNTVVNYSLVLAPFQKQTIIEFSNVKIKETAVRFLTVINPLDKPRQFVLPPASDGVYFDVHDFTLQPKSQCKITITWKPSVCGNMRKLIKIEQLDGKIKFDFVILGNCISSTNKKSKATSVTYLRSKNPSLIKKQLSNGRKKIILNKTRVVNCKSERIVLVGNAAKLSESVGTKDLESPIRRQTYLVGEKENLPSSKKNIFGEDFTDSDFSFKRPDKKRQDQVFNNHFNIQDINLDCSLLSNDSLNEPLPTNVFNNSPFNDFCLTPLKSTENLISPFSSTNKEKALNITNENVGFTSFNTSPFKPIDASTGAKTSTSDEIKPTRISVNLCKKFAKSPEDEPNKTFIKNTTPKAPKTELSFDLSLNNAWITPRVNQSGIFTLSCSKPKRPSFVIKNSPFYKCSPKSSISKNRLKQLSVLSPRAKRSKTSKMDKCDQYLKCLANPELVYHSNAEDPFLKMSQYYEAEWLDRQESDMICWLNALLMPTDKLVEEEPLSNLEQAFVAWEQASKTSHKNKPMQFATQKDLFAAQIYRQSPQQWSALRKATSNLITSTKVATVLSKLTVSIDKDLITVRDDRQIHLDLNLKKKIIDLLKCYNPLWLRIGLEAIYGQIILVKQGSNDLDGLGWFIRKHLFNNDFVKQKFTKTNVLQVNLPAYNIAMKKFILRKFLMLVYFLDCAKDQQLIRHNPCLFKIDSPYKSSHDFLMGFCADLVTAHGDINRRLRDIGYNLTHKQTHLDEVNYAVKSLNDLRDGTRITKVVEILFKGEPLSHKLRLPAISKLQKIHNVDLALSRISDHINIEGNITKRDIVNGHREKMLSLFWQIIYKYLTPRYNKAATKIQLWWRNSGLKLVIMKRIRAKQSFRRHLAASKIQALVRGYLAREQWLRVRSELIENRERLHVASTLIKRYLQNKLKLLTEERKQFIILKRTVVFVQRKFRSNVALKRDQQQYMRYKKSILMIQKVYRGYAVRKNWSHIKNRLINDKIKRINAINIIKHALRKNLPPNKDELNYKKLIFVTLAIQRQFRANILMKSKRKEFLSLKKSAIVIQRQFRANQAMINEKENYSKLQKNIVIVQATIRGFVIRRQWPALRERLMAEKMYLVVSSDIIKRALRRNLPITYDRVQFLDLKNSTIIIQRKFRALLDMRQQRQYYLWLKMITIKLQSLARGYIQRKYWPSLRERLKAEKMYLVASSDIVKRALRRNLPITYDRVQFLDLKNAVILMQRRFRASQDMKKQREQYLQLKIATLKLQSVTRGFLVRKQWPILQNQLYLRRLYMNNCSNIIKRCLRQNLPVTKDRTEFIRLKVAALMIQRKFRALQVMRNERENYIIKKRSVIKLQSIIRGFIVRKQWPTLRSQLQSNKLQLINCSNIIKRTLRMNLPLSEDRVKYIELKKSAIVLQRRFRGMRDMKLQRTQYLHLVTATVKLQGLIRGYLSRKQWPFLKNNLIARRQHLINCSNVIKRTLRKNLPNTIIRLWFLEVKKSASVIQNKFRAYKQRKQYQTLRNNVIIVQRKFRAKMAMKHQKQTYSNTKKMTIRLQAHIRGYLVRKTWPTTKNILEANKKHVNAASNTIKRFLRRCLPPTSDRLRYLQLRHSVKNLQAIYRANVAMKSAEREYLLLKYCVITLQRNYRQLRAMKAQKQHYDCLKKSTIILQAHIRGYLARKRWSQLKDSLETYHKHKQAIFECKSLVARHAFLFELKVEMRAAIRLQNWIRNEILTRKHLQKKNAAATKIQAVTRGFLVRKKLPQIKHELTVAKLGRVATKIQAIWRGYRIRKRILCRRETIRAPKKGALTLGKRHNNVVDMLNKQKRNEYSYQELTTIFWNLDTCTSLSKELCLKTAESTIIDYIFHFLQYSNQSQPSIEAREPAIRVLTNLLKYHETSWQIWMRAVNADMVVDLIKIMKTCCGKICANKLYCSIASWIWIALQDPEKKLYIKNIPTAIVDLKLMMETLNKKFKTRKIDKKTMLLPSTRPTWSIGSKCQKCFDSDLYATTQICKLLNI